MCAEACACDRMPHMPKPVFPIYTPCSNLRNMSMTSIYVIWVERVKWSKGSVSPFVKDASVSVLRAEKFNHFEADLCRCVLFLSEDLSGKNHDPVFKLQT